MRMFDVQGIEIMAPHHNAFEFLREPTNLPRWAHAFVSAGNGRARLETPAGAVDVALGVTADAECRKRGHKDALALLGYGQTPRVSIEGVGFTPKRVRIGGRVAMTFGLKSTSTKQQRLLVDVAVHFLEARGVSARKVFKLGRLTLGPRERIDLKTTFSLAVHTTRVPRPGRHDVDVIVNGCAVRAGSFEVSKP